MPRYFNIKITGGTAQGPYTIYYNSVSPSTYATRVSTSLPATGVTYNALTVGTGVAVQVPDTATSIILDNAICNKRITYTLPPAKKTFPNCTDGVLYKWALVKTTGLANPNNIKSNVVKSGNVEVVQQNEFGDIVRARLIGLPKIWVTPPILFRRIQYSIIISDCNGNLCCYVWTQVFKVFFQLRITVFRTIFFPSNLVESTPYSQPNLENPAKPFTRYAFCRDYPTSIIEFVGQYKYGSNCSNFTEAPWFI